MGRAGLPPRGPEGLSPPDGGTEVANKASGLAREEDARHKRSSFVTRREFLTVERGLAQVQAELKCLRWQVGQMGEEGAQPLAEEEPRRYNGYTWTELEALVRRERDPDRAARTILAALFSDVCLRPPPATEPACEAQALRKPHIDPELYMVYCGILQSVFPGLRGEREGAGPAQTSQELLCCGADPGQQREEGSLA